MRTTLDIEADVLQAAKEIAAKEKSTTGKVISRLVRASLIGQPTISSRASTRNGVPVIKGTGQIITMEHIQKLMDEEAV